MINHITYNGILYEITVGALAHDDGYSVEIFDMSPLGALLGEARVTAERVTLVAQEDMPPAVYRRWASAIIDASGVEGDPADPE